MRKKIVVLFSFILLFVTNASATHIAGADINYVCLGNNQYQITLNLFADCFGILPAGTQTIHFSSTCGDTISITAVNTNPGGTEISQLCPTQINSSTCHGGVLPGMRVYHYSGVASLVQPCDTWTMSWQLCCRNAAILNLLNPNSAGSYIEATLHSITSTCNNSPAFTAQPIPYVCANQLVNYDYGVIETDGDSLNYSLADAMDQGATLLPYSPGYSATSPIAGITIDPNSGLLSFTPTLIGNFVVVALVKEYDRSSGTLIGTVMRDIQFIVQNCPNIVPEPTAGVVSNLTGAAVQTAPYSIEMCEGSTFTFDAVYTDVNAGNVLSYITDLSLALPGATITSSGANPMTATISWTAPGGSANTNTSFGVTVTDGACPVVGAQGFMYDININPKTLAGADQVICGTQGATLHATGGSVFTWSVLSGSPMQVGTNFSCNPCANPVATPSATTVYQLTSDLSGTCGNKDTVKVTLVPDFALATTQGTSGSCLLQPIQLNATVVPAGLYSYLWSPSNYLNSTVIADPIANIALPGGYIYSVDVTSPQGCVKIGLVLLDVKPSYSPNAVAYTSDAQVCVGDTVQLGVTFGITTPAACSINPVGCTTSSVAAVGNGVLSCTSTSLAEPAPYGNWYTSERYQFLFTAAELHAAGITGGKIDQLDFNVTQINGITAYHEYTIKMGCTSLSDLNSSFVFGLAQVYNPKIHNVVLGWNPHVFDNAYEWDGFSNLIVEICFSEGPGTSGFSNYTVNCSSPYTTTSFFSCLFSGSDNQDMCSVDNAPVKLQNRPNVQFHYCSVAPDSSRYTYNWFPAVSSTSAATTVATVNTSTNYYAIVTDTVSGCFDTAFVFVQADVTTLNISAGNDVTICPGGSATLLATGASEYTWSPATALSSINTASTNASPATTTTYTVTGKSTCATGVLSDNVTVFVPSSTALTVKAAADQEVCVGDTYLLKALGSGGYAGNTYSWSLLSGTASDSIHPSNSQTASVTATVANTNTYLVTITDACGNRGYDTTVVDVLLDCDLIIPNIFTPNADGVNDFFVPKGRGIKKYSITVYDRWGLKLFESEHIKLGWDGRTTSGINCVDGIYYYLIQAEMVNGKVIDEKGYLQLIRN
jgi:gliding motility-associated-like protein